MSLGDPEFPLNVHFWLTWLVNFFFDVMHIDKHLCDAQAFFRGHARNSFLKLVSIMF